MTSRCDLCGDIVGITQFFKLENGQVVGTCYECKDKHRRGQWLPYSMNKPQTEERKSTMTKQQEFKKNLAEAISQGTEYIAAVLDCLEKNPELKKMGTKLIEEYLEFLLPAARKILSEGMKVREEAFIRFKQLGLSDELAVKMACGR